SRTPRRTPLASAARLHAQQTLCTPRSLARETRSLLPGSPPEQVRRGHDALALTLTQATHSGEIAAAASKGAVWLSGPAFRFSVCFNAVRQEGPLAGARSPAKQYASVGHQGDNAHGDRLHRGGADGVSHGSPASRSRTPPVRIRHAARAFGSARREGSANL